MLYFWCRLLWFVLVSLPAAVHLSLIKPSVLSKPFFFFIAFHPTTRERRGFINISSSILDGVALFFLCLLVYAMIWTSLLPATCFFSFWFSLYVVRCIRAHIYTFKFALLHFYTLLSLPTITNVHSISYLLYYQLYLYPDKRNLRLSHSIVEARL